MREVIRTNQFKRDVKLAEKRGKDVAKLREVILLLMNEAPLLPRYKDHPLAATGSTTATATSNQTGCCFTRSTATICIWSGPEATPICSDPKAQEITSVVFFN